MTHSRNLTVTLRGLWHMGWVVGVAGLVAALSERAEFMPTLVAVVLAHSAWRAAEMETPC